MIMITTTMKIAKLMILLILILKELECCRDIVLRYRVQNLPIVQPGRFQHKQKKNVIVFFVVETIISLRLCYVISLNGDHLGSAFLDCQNKDKISYRKERVKQDALDLLLFIILFQCFLGNAVHQESLLERIANAPLTSDPLSDTGLAGQQLCFCKFHLTDFYR